MNDFPNFPGFPNMGMPRSAEQERADGVLARTLCELINPPSTGAVAVLPAWGFYAPALPSPAADDSYIDEAFALALSIIEARLLEVAEAEIAAGVTLH